MTDTFPTVAEVDRIAALGDPAIRNLQITQCYYELSAALAERTGLSANWCTFATWASKQAGQAIRKEDLARTLENALDTAPAATQAAGNEVQSLHQSLDASRGCRSAASRRKFRRQVPRPNPEARIAHDGLDREL